MKTKKGQNKMKTLNEKNLERINYLIYEINRDNDICKNIKNESGSKFWFSFKCYYDAKIKSVELYEEYGIRITSIVDCWIEEKDRLIKSRSEGCKMYNQCMKAKDEKRANA